MRQYTLGLFANMYPCETGQSTKNNVLPDPYRGLFIKKMVQKLESKGVFVKKAVKTVSSPWGYIPFYADSIHLSFDPTVEILQAHYIPHSSIIPVLLKRKRPLILKFHGDDGRIYPYANRINRLITVSMIRRADHIITASQEIRQKIIELGATPDKVTPISSGVNTEQFTSSNPEAAKKKFGLPLEIPLFLYVGRIHPRKGVNEIIAVAKEHPNSLFVFAGPGLVPPHPDNCKFLGELSPDTIPSLINAADVSLLPSYSEGISNFIMESLSCQVPVIASDVGGTPEIVHHQENGLLIPPKNTHALSLAISWMKENENERKTLGKKGRDEMLTQYNDDVLINRMIGIHHSLLT